jgi:UrcA family protein
MTSTLLKCVAASALAVSAFAAPSFADPYYGYTEDEIVVTAPYTIYRDRDRNGEVVRVSRVVASRDLDLRYASHADELRRRISDNARIACEQAERALRGASQTSDRECVRKAVRAAEPQFVAAVERSRYYASR